MEGDFWRITDARSGRVIVALCGVNRAPDGVWANVALAGHPGGFAREADVPLAGADPCRLAVWAGPGAFEASSDRLRVDLGPDARLDVRLRGTWGWPRRTFGGSGPAHALPGRGQYWHPHVLGGTVEGSAVRGDVVVELDGAHVYAEKNWGAGGFPPRWWWGQAQGFDAPEVCVAFAGGKLALGPLQLDPTALVVRLGPDVIRLGNPLVAPVHAEIGGGQWSLRGRGPTWSVEVEGAAPPADAHILPAQLPAQRRSVPGALEHLAAPLRVVVRKRGRVVSVPIPRPSRLSLWIRATRPLYLPTSLIPALAGGLVAIGEPDADWWLLPVALVALLLVHAATNACNDVEHAARGLDPPDKIANSGVFNTGLLSTGEGRRPYGALFALAFALGVGICLVQGPALLLIGSVGILVGWLYTAGPRPYKYDGLGDPAIALLMGPLLTQGTYTAVTGDGFDASAFWLGFAPGFMIAAVLAANNLADIDGDRTAGVRTLEVRLGFHRARWLFVGLLTVGTLTPALVCAAGLFGPRILVPILLAPLALARMAQALRPASSGDESVLTLTPGTAQLHLLFAMLLCVGVVLDRV
jgi:1,4-dihydroxy-2-naphthoate octaprenyltransferase